MRLPKKQLHLFKLLKSQNQNASHKRYQLMAISIVATVGSASANSYVTLTQAQAFIDGLTESEDVVAWGNSTDDQKTGHYLAQPKGLIVKSFWELELPIHRHLNGQDQE